MLSNSGAFAVEQVTVSGADHLSGDELTELAAVPAGSTLLNVDANGIATRLAANPWVKSVSVDRVFPNTLNLNITERSISAVVAVTLIARIRLSVGLFLPMACGLRRFPTIATAPKARLCPIRCITMRKTRSKSPIFRMDPRQKPVHTATTQMLRMHWSNRRNDYRTGGPGQSVAAASSDSTELHHCKTASKSPLETLRTFATKSACA